MKSFTITATTFAATLVPAALGCLRVHADLLTEPLMDDVMQIQIWEGNTQVCKDGESEFFSDNEDRFTAKCGDYEATVWDNGRQGEVWNHAANYHAILKQINHDRTSYCCLMTDTGCKLNCSVWETCLNDGHDSCSGDYASCDLCDFRGVCDDI